MTNKLHCSRSIPGDESGIRIPLLGPIESALHISKHSDSSPRRCFTFAIFSLQNTNGKILSWQTAPTIDIAITTILDSEYKVEYRQTRFCYFSLPFSTSSRCETSATSFWPKRRRKAYAALGSMSLLIGWRRGRSRAILTTSQGLYGSADSKLKQRAVSIPTSLL